MRQWIWCLDTEWLIEGLLLSQGMEGCIFQERNHIFLEEGEAFALEGKTVSRRFQKLIQKGCACMPPVFVIVVLKGQDFGQNFI